MFIREKLDIHKIRSFQKTFHPKIQNGILLFENDPQLDVESLAFLNEFHTLLIRNYSTFQAQGLQNMVFLKNLTLQNCNLTDEQFQILDNPALCNLESLDVSHNKLKTMEPVIPLISLKNLDVSHNQIFNQLDFAFLMWMENLQSLKIQGNPVVLKASDEEEKQLKYHTFLRCVFYGVWMSENTFQFVSIHGDSNQFDELKVKEIFEMNMYVPNPFLETEEGRIQAERLEKKITAINQILEEAVVNADAAIEEQRKLTAQIQNAVQTIRDINASEIKM